MGAIRQHLRSPSYSDPVTSALVVAPNDNADIGPTATRAIYVGTAGNVNVTMLDGQTVVFPSLANGWHPICATRIWATNTTATGIVATW